MLAGNLTSIFRPDTRPAWIEAALVVAFLRIPLESDHDSAVMPTAVPLASRPAFRSEADRDSGAIRPVC